MGTRLSLDAWLLSQPEVPYLQWRNYSAQVKGRGLSLKMQSDFFLGNASKNRNRVRPIDCNQK